MAIIGGGTLPTTTGSEECGQFPALPGVSLPCSPRQFSTPHSSPGKTPRLGLPFPSSTPFPHILPSNKINIFCILSLL